MRNNGTQETCCMERNELHIKQFSELKVPHDGINLKPKSNYLLKKHTEAHRVAPLLWAMSLVSQP